MNSSTENSGTDCCQHDAIMAQLRSIPHFSEVALDTLKVLAILCTPMNYHPGTVIFNQGDSDDKAYLIMSGEAEVSRANDNETIRVGRFGPGSFVGALALTADVKRLFTLSAVGPLVCLNIRRKHFLQALENQPGAQNSFNKILAHSIVDWEEALLRAGKCPADSLGSTGVSLL